MMRIGLFLILSTALHATALSYPVLFLTARAETLFFPVTVLPIEKEADGGSPRPGAHAATKQHRTNRPQREAARKPILTNEITPAQSAEQNRLDPALIATPDPSEGIAVAANPTAAPVDEPSVANPAASAGDAGESSGHGKATTAANGYGTGDGTAAGTGSTRGRTAVTSAYSPKPEYPESARREGREGTVVLRVLVDEEGRSKSLEINRSSGFAALDQAAIETVRRWRFHSARYADKRVESWVRIPIEFHLTETKD